MATAYLRVSLLMGIPIPHTLVQTSKISVGSLSKIVAALYITGRDSRLKSVIAHPRCLFKKEGRYQNSTGTSRFGRGKPSESRIRCVQKGDTISCFSFYTQIRARKCQPSGVRKGNLPDPFQSLCANGKHLDELHYAQRRAPLCSMGDGTCTGARDAWSQSYRSMPCCA